MTFWLASSTLFRIKCFLYTKFQSNFNGLDSHFLKLNPSLWIKIHLNMCMLTKVFKLLIIPHPHLFLAKWMLSSFIKVSITLHKLILQANLAFIVLRGFKVSLPFSKSFNILFNCWLTNLIYFFFSGRHKIWARNMLDPMKTNTKVGDFFYQHLNKFLLN